MKKYTLIPTWPFIKRVKSEIPDLTHGKSGPRVLHNPMSAEELKFRQGAMWKPENSVSKEPLHTETTGGFSSNNGPVPFEPFNDGGAKYPWRLVKSTKHKVMYFLKANYPNSYSGREIARATGLNTSQVGGALKHCGDHVKKVGTHVGPKGCVGFKWQGVLKERV